MMFGLRDEFTYDECGVCGVVQLRTAPVDPGRFYGDGYYSLGAVARPGLMWTLARRARNVLMYRNPLGAGRAIGGLLPRFPAHKVEWLAHTRTRADSRILDVGSGVGVLVRDLGDAGFRSVRGIDPFLDGAICYGPGVTVEPATIHEVNGTFDLIMMHHSLEHIVDQAATLQRAAELLAPDGWCLVRIPVTSSFAWRHYREHWVQLDPPRHYVLHSVDSFRRLAAAAGLRVDRVIHDSDALQFFGSEAYRRDVPLTEAAALFTPQEMREFTRRAAELNERGEGDQAAFYLRRA